MADTDFCTSVNIHIDIDRIMYFEILPYEALLDSHLKQEVNKVIDEDLRISV